MPTHARLPRSSQEDHHRAAVQALTQVRLGFADVCNVLEHIADRLPRIDALHCRDVAAALSGLPAIHTECLAIFDALARDDETGRLLAARLATEYASEDAAAQEIVAALLSAAERGRVDDAEALGYLLRCFFTAYPRLMLVETLAIRLLRHRRRDGLSLLDDDGEDSEFRRSIAAI